jgi:DNA-binding beta-propeller fold protein YncE
VLVTFAGNGVPGFAGDEGPARHASLNRPRGLALAGGTLYIADSENHRIRAVDLASSVITTVAGTGDPGFGGDGGDPLRALLDAPAAVSTTADGALLFIAEPNNRRIRLVDLRADRIVTFAGNGESEFGGDLRSAGETALSAPMGVATSPLEVLFIADSGHDIVLRTTIGLRTGTDQR